MSAVSKSSASQYDPLFVPGPWSAEAFLISTREREVILVRLREACVVERCISLRIRDLQSIVCVPGLPCDLIRNLYVTGGAIIRIIELLAKAPQRCASGHHAANQ